MMFTKKSFVDEIANSMQRQLVDGAINKQAEQESQLVKVANHLNAAAEIFDESGMIAHAEIITTVLEALAAKKKDKNKAKDKKKKPAKKSVKKAPSSEKMVNNLKQKGWMFDESDAHDEDCADDNCASCGDTSYADDDSDEQWWHLSHPESGGYSSLRGSATDAAKHLELKNRHLSPGWELNGPFANIDDLEKKHHSKSIDDEDMMLSDDKDTDSDELYSMLNDFKSKDDMDFEDELDFDDFENREGVKVHDPFADYDKVHVSEDLPEDVKVHDPFSDFEKLYVDR
jgi:hypothetical protein